MVSWPALALASLPVLTGLASTLWSMLVTTSRSSAALGNVVCYAIVFLVIRGLMDDGVPLSSLLRGRNPAIFAAYVVSSVLVSLAWVVALKGNHVAAIGLVEIGYPVFVILFAALLVGPVRLTPGQWFGGALVAIGMVLVVACAAPDSPAAAPEPPAPTAG